MIVAQLRATEPLETWLILHPDFPPMRLRGAVRDCGPFWVPRVQYERE